MDDHRETEPGLLLSRGTKYPRKWVFFMDNEEPSSAYYSPETKVPVF